LLPCSNRWLHASLSSSSNNQDGALLQSTMRVADDGHFKLCMYTSGQGAVWELHDAPAATVLARRHTPVTWPPSSVSGAARSTWRSTSASAVSSSMAPCKIYNGNETALSGFNLALAAARTFDFCTMPEERIQDRVTNDMCSVLSQPQRSSLCTCRLAAPKSWCAPAKHSS
jgi:hypothetical protein